MEEKAKIKFMNTLGRKIEIFVPIDESKIKMYTCGPTVYSEAHIGNMRAYIFSDIVRRVLEYGKYKVKQVMNITDVGHLTSDADEGEDKLQKAAIEQKTTAWDISKKYTKQFLDDTSKLNIHPVHVLCKATDHIPEQISLIKKLEKKGFTYLTSDGVYYDTSKFPRYGDLAKLDVEGLQAGKRIKIGEKRNKTDFALWKFSKSGEKRDMEWNSPWGKGFPGWHIECSAMSMKYLGETFDIHTGGIDHIPIHHTNEIAQSEGATGSGKFVNYWLHHDFLISKKEKISKSTGGLLTLTELEQKGFMAVAYRYFVLTAHYRKPLDFSLKNLKNAQNSYDRLKNISSEIRDDGKTNISYLKKFKRSINDDLNTPKALAVLWGLLRDEKAKGKYQTIKEMDRVLGLDILKKEEMKIPRKVQRMVKEREKARKNKDWKKADDVRDQILDSGFIIEDTLDGQRLKKR
jgi:cysteinyl-tRNA synthetase|tara:strand:- start:499 stop:1878 length:1380 start_codon:yes stop_codon:yes gene_type:complete